MNLPDPQAIANAWMSQMSDPTQWQPWFNLVPEMEANPVAAMLKEAGMSMAPDAIEQLKSDYMASIGTLWQDFMSGKAPAVADRRFSSTAWQNNPMSAFSAASYLLNAKFLTAMADAVDTNPEAQQKLIETKGESLARGLANMLGDMNKGHISQSDESAYEVGRNLAMTEGTVVYENRLFQLIQYKPQTAQVHTRPLLMVPPCINKYYILDLQPENSVVRYAVEQGNTVFLISWANPDKSLADTTWDQYVEEGVIQAIRVVQDITGQDKMNAFGFCVGGTIVSTALAVLAARGEKPASSLTLLTTFLDFSDTGVLSVFVDEPQVALREQALKAGGLMSGRDLASTFSSLRPNDLVWNYVQSNYLKGNEPPPFDLLYWNADSTNLPGPMFCWYLRNTYLENSLKKPGRLTVAGEAVDLGAIDCPVFVYGSREDHIVPWTSAFSSVNILNPNKPEKNRYVLGASGHIAGVINPASKKKRSYWTNDELKRKNGKLDAEEWMKGATEHPGSWWPEWAAFLAEHGGKDVKPPAKPGNAQYQPVEAAPGRYVKAKAD
jgi:polyhydroxyalkanoate synthase